MQIQMDGFSLGGDVEASLYASDVHRTSSRLDHAVFRRQLRHLDVAELRRDAHRFAVDGADVHVAFHRGDLHLRTQQLSRLHVSTSRPHVHVCRQLAQCDVPAAASHVCAHAARLSDVDLSTAAVHVQVGFHHRFHMHVAAAGGHVHAAEARRHVEGGRTVQDRRRRRLAASRRAVHEAFVDVQAHFFVLRALLHDHVRRGRRRAHRKPPACDHAPRRDGRTHRRERRSTWSNWAWTWPSQPLLGWSRPTRFVPVHGNATVCKDRGRSPSRQAMRMRSSAHAMCRQFAVHGRRMGRGFVAAACAQVQGKLGRRSGVWRGAQGKTRVLSCQ
mmetsp:Transcript_8525/g.53276  ORF Transcript_8525/g.53276 Transcript_8525/m.53276 type:complete len:330 (+) Transcript_8525:2015-3004(+)